MSFENVGDPVQVADYSAPYIEIKKQLDKYITLMNDGKFEAGLSLLGEVDKQFCKLRNENWNMVLGVNRK